MLYVACYSGSRLCANLLYVSISLSTISRTIFHYANTAHGKQSYSRGRPDLKIPSLRVSKVY